MPCTDPRDVTRLADAFDLTTTEIRQWELDLIWRALALGLIVLSTHADDACTDEAIDPKQIWRVIHDGVPRSKDLDLSGTRKPGINFEGKVPGGRRVRTKVSWLTGYIVATVHTL